MVKISLKPRFILDSLKVLISKSPKALVLGEQASMNNEDKEMHRQILFNVDSSRNFKTRSGIFESVDTLHKGSGRVVLPEHPTDSSRSFLLLDHDFKVTQGQDLFPYLLTSREPKNKLGDFMDLGLVKGNKGAQIYVIDQSIDLLGKYQSVAIYCKQFSVLFSFATLR